LEGKCWRPISVHRVQDFYGAPFPNNPRIYQGFTMINNKLIRILGPGLIFAAISVGVSHLIQSTRAGAMYGLAMLVFIIFAYAAKYPAFRFGQQYTSVTGNSLVEGFRRQGNWALYLFAIIIFVSMFTGLAAVTLVTAGLAKICFGLGMNLLTTSVGLMFICTLLLFIGNYQWLEIAIKILIALMAVSTLSATFISLPLIDWTVSGAMLPANFDMPTILFIVTLIGWMPAPIDVAIMQSLWTKEKIRSFDKNMSWSISRIDFHIGYITSGLMAVCFLLLGTAVMHGSKLEFENDTTGFATQLINLYTQALGGWSRPFIAVSAFAVMFSTMVSIIDVYPRVIANLTIWLQHPDMPEQQYNEKTIKFIYRCSMIILVLGALAILSFFTGSFTALVGLATTFAFLSAPVLAWLVHRSMLSSCVSVVDRPGNGLQIYSLCSIGLLGLFALYYIYLLLIT